MGDTSRGQSLCVKCRLLGREPCPTGMAAMADEHDQPDRDTMSTRTPRTYSAIAVIVIDEQLECLAEQVSGRGEANRPHDRTNQIEHKKAQPRHMRGTDRKRRDVAQTVIETKGENQKVLMAVQKLVDLLRALLPGQAAWQ